MFALQLSAVAFSPRFLYTVMFADLPTNLKLPTDDYYSDFDGTVFSVHMLLAEGQHELEYGCPSEVIQQLTLEVSEPASYSYILCGKKLVVQLSQAPIEVLVTPQCNQFFKPYEYGQVCIVGPYIDKCTQSSEALSVLLDPEADYDVVYRIDCGVADLVAFSGPKIQINAQSTALPAFLSSGRTTIRMGGISAGVYTAGIQVDGSAQFAVYSGAQVDKFVFVGSDAQNYVYLKHLHFNAAQKTCRDSFEAQLGGIALYHAVKASTLYHYKNRADSLQVSGASPALADLRALGQAVIIDYEQDCDVADQGLWVFVDDSGIWLDRAEKTCDLRKPECSIDIC